MRLLLAVLAALAAFPAAAAPPSGMEVVSNAINEVIRPGFISFSENAAALQADFGRLCAAPSDELLQTAREQFGFTVAAWSAVEFIRLGPLGADNRSERLLFWPDRKGIALRQVQAILAEQDESATDPDRLAGKSVAVQGLGALEFVLFGTDAGQLAQPAGDFRCRFGQAIATNIAGLAETISAEWLAPDGISRRLEHPLLSDPDYRTRREVLEALTGTLAHGIEALRDQRLLPFLGRNGEAPKPKSALFWRSGLTVPAIRANFAGLETLFRLSRIAKATDAENLWVANGAAFEFANAARAGSLVTLPLEQAVADPKQKQALAYLVIVTQSLQTLLGENLAAALGLSVGFSSLDGD